ncbi:MAG: RidA family protein [Planctomycetaceae bacterium]
MAVRLVNPDALVKPRGYAHAAIGSGRAILLAGQIGCDATGRIEAPGDLAAQFARALDNLLVALRAAGGKPEELAHLRIFVTDVGDYRARAKTLGEAWRARFGRHYPPMTLAEVKGLFDPAALVEIEGIAYAG